MIMRPADAARVQEPVTGVKLDTHIRLDSVVPSKITMRTPHHGRMENRARVALCPSLEAK